jgi:hypothetical protein
MFPTFRFDRRDFIANPSYRMSNQCANTLAISALNVFYLANAKYYNVKSRRDSIKLNETRVKFEIRSIY